MNVVSVEEAARRLGVSRFTVRAWLRQRKLEHFKLGRRVVLSESAIANFLERHRVEAQEPLVGRRQVLNVEARDPGGR
jgi:excisionase family DNA binding protein